MDRKQPTDVSHQSFGVGWSLWMIWALLWVMVSIVFVVVVVFAR